MQDDHHFHGNEVRRIFSQAFFTLIIINIQLNKCCVHGRPVNTATAGRLQELHAGFNFTHLKLAVT